MGLMIGSVWVAGGVALGVISLDGLKDVNDKFRGVDDTYAAVMRGIESGPSELVTFGAKSCLAVMRGNKVYTYSGSHVNCGNSVKVRHRILRNEFLTRKLLKKHIYRTLYTCLLLKEVYTYTVRDVAFFT